MEADAQVNQLEQALIRQAESLAREQHERAESGKARILNDASERIRLAEKRVSILLAIPVVQHSSQASVLNVDTVRLRELSGRFGNPLAVLGGLLAEPRLDGLGRVFVAYRAHADPPSRYKRRFSM